MPVTITRRIVMIFAALLGILFVAGCEEASEPAVPPSQQGPAMWRIDSAVGEVYLFGSIHLLPPDTEWRRPALDDVISTASSLWQEVDPKETESREFQQLIIERGVYRGEGSLSAAVGADLAKELDALASEIGLPPQALEPMRPWLAVVTLTLAYAQKHGFDPASGVEQELAKAFATRGIDVDGLETPFEAISSLANLSPEIQNAMLTDMVRQLSDVGAQLEALHQAWLSGDTQRLQDLVFKDLGEYPEAYQAIIVKRNQAWLPAIEQLAARPGVHLVSVGAAHLIGPDGLVALLDDHGYKVERVTGN